MSHVRPAGRPLCLTKNFNVGHYLTCTTEFGILLRLVGLMNIILILSCPFKGENLT